MKILLKNSITLKDAERWDIDYHLPPEEIEKYPINIRLPVSELATVSTTTTDPSLTPEESFLYVDIASIDIRFGEIVNPQELLGEEAPSRARMVIHSNYVLVSMVRPNRRAIAVVTDDLDNQVCSTGFCVLKCKKGVDPYYLQFVLRLPSTMEQFRKYSTGSSYPAILAEDVLKTIVPSVKLDLQPEYGKLIREARKRSQEFLRKAEAELTSMNVNLDDKLMKFESK